MKDNSTFTTSEVHDAMFTAWESVQGTRLLPLGDWHSFLRHTWARLDEIHAERLAETLRQKQLPLPWQRPSVSQEEKADVEEAAC